MRILINYPVVDSLGTDNRGGYSHLLANIAMYSQIEARTVVICRLNLKKIVHITKGAIFFNVVPGRKDPNAQTRDVLGNVSIYHLMRAKLQKLARVIINLLLSSLVKLLCIFFGITYIHERLNKRFSIPHNSIFFKKNIFIYEKNDQFSGHIRSKDFLLTTPKDPYLHDNVLRSSWPVIATGKSEHPRFNQNVDRLRSLTTVSVCLYGVGGLNTLDEITKFLKNHIWLRNKQNIELTICGSEFDISCADTRNIVINIVPFMPPTKIANFDLGLAFYSPNIYSNERLALGAPTKIFNYIDHDVPFITNVDYYSQKYLLGFDKKDLRNITVEEVNQTYHNLKMARYESSLELYAQNMKRLLDI